MSKKWTKALQPKKTRRKLSEEDLEDHIKNRQLYSGQVHKDKKKFDRKRSRQQKWDSE